MNQPIKRGEIYCADLSPVVGSEQGGVRPILILQNDTGNRHSPTTIVAAISGCPTKAELPAVCAAIPSFFWSRSARWTNPASAFALPGWARKPWAGLTARLLPASGSNTWRNCCETG